MRLPSCATATAATAEAATAASSSGLSGVDAADAALVALRQAIATGLLLMSAQVCQIVEALTVSVARDIHVLKLLADAVRPCPLWLAGRAEQGCGAADRHLTGLVQCPSSCMAF